MFIENSPKTKKLVKMVIPTKTPIAVGTEELINRLITSTGGSCGGS